MSAFDPKRTSDGEANGKYCPATYVRGAFFLSFRAYIHRAWALWSRISAPVAASINTAMKGVVPEQTRRKGDIVKNSKEALKKQADARFKKDERVREGTKAMLEYEAEGRTVRAKTARLRALRFGQGGGGEKRRGRSGLRLALGCQKKGEPWLLVARILECNRGWRRLHGKITISAWTTKSKQRLFERRPRD